MKRQPMYMKGVMQAVDNFTRREVSRGTHFEDEYFICQKCEGSGKLYYVKGEDGTTCDLCDGSGKIHLKFTITRV